MARILRTERNKKSTVGKQAPNSIAPNFDRMFSLKEIGGRLWWFRMNRHRRPPIPRKARDEDKPTTLAVFDRLSPYQTLKASKRQNIKVLRCVLAIAGALYTIDVYNRQGCVSYQ